jgi:hypothetical protein
MKRNNTSSTHTFTNACQRLHNLSNICMNWIATHTSLPVQRVTCESGCMRSDRLARLTPVTHEVTSRSFVQLTLLPDSFSDLRHRGYEHQGWVIHIYSWLPADDTKRLVAHLLSKEDCKGVTLFAVKPKTCQKVGALHA